MPFVAVTSFLCLRFVSPAIMAPKLFHLRERHADARTSRTLLLLAKVRLQVDAQLGAEQGSSPRLHCVPNWLQGVLGPGPLILSRGTVYKAFPGHPVSWVRKQACEGKEVAQGHTACWW